MRKDQRGFRSDPRLELRPCGLVSCFRPHKIITPETTCSILTHFGRSRP